MYVTMMMTDQIPLELPPLLNGEVAMMPHLVNGDAAQQVILVQVNPGETFTIRAEDGTLQCIQDMCSCYLQAGILRVDLRGLFQTQACC
ncbi:fibronectin type III domain-containing protein 3B-like [Lontra canadensis]|uniref:fibronectin type III domain-containing protein 3B-like n=1 Tax=Lontra canadensis TaxID=76717 RepID=UPI0013F2F113|nr:fibronectin type III domain-containing protein 3B-like [Lontra canadensis]XP_032706351.1 fibronectin type III domain-containing protein 3B-like [Lontra canadensis]